MKCIELNEGDHVSNGQVIKVVVLSDGDLSKEQLDAELEKQRAEEDSKLMHIENEISLPFFHRFVVDNCVEWRLFQDFVSYIRMLPSCPFIYLLVF